MRRKEKNSHVPDQRKYLSNEEENEFVQFLLDCASLGYPRTRKQVTICMLFMFIFSAALTKV